MWCSWEVSLFGSRVETFQEYGLRFNTKRQGIEKIIEYYKEHCKNANDVIYYYQLGVVF